MTYQNQPVLDPRAVEEHEALNTSDQEIIKKHMFGNNVYTAAFAVENKNSKKEDIERLMSKMVEENIDHYFLYSICQIVLTEKG